MSPVTNALADRGSIPQPVPRPTTEPQPIMQAMLGLLQSPDHAQELYKAYLDGFRHIGASGSLDNEYRQPGVDDESVWSRAMAQMMGQANQAKALNSRERLYSDKEMMQGEDIARGLFPSMYRRDL